MAFEVEQLKEIGFSDTDCESVAVLEKALQSGRYPKGTYKPIGKPYMINFRKVTLLYFEYLTAQLSGEPDKFCPSVKSIKKGICSLSNLFLGKDELPKRSAA